MMTAIQDIEIETQNLDQLGLVAGMCDEIGLVDAIDAACGQQAKNKHLTYGECVKSMILNGLGFVGRTLYLYSEYAASGNSSDKSAFAEIVQQHLASFQAAVNNRYLVGDSALYTPDSLTAVVGAKGLFVTRVPMQISEAKELVNCTVLSDMMPLGEGYYAKESTSSYAEIQQRWVVIFSQAAYERECKTLDKNVRKGVEQESKAFAKLAAEVFSCPIRCRETS